ncbi:MAG: ABC transporter permease [Lachnospiraceae bacterium]|nr:ABC transporter permease [Lachnospiraceae bacterium]
MIYTVVVGFYKMALSIAMEIQGSTSAAIMLIGLLYGSMIFSVMFKMQILMNRSIWSIYHEMGMMKKEAARMIVIEDVVLITFGAVLGSVLGNWIIYHLYQPTINVVTLDVVIILCIVIVFLIAFFLQLEFLFSHIWYKEPVDRYDIAYKREGIPLSVKNVIREKSKLYFIVMTITFGVVIFNTIIIVLKSDQSDIYFDKAICVDFFLSAVDTSENEMRKEEQYVLEEDILQVERSNYFLDGGRLFHNLNREKVTLQTTQLPEASSFELFYGREFERALDGNYYLNLYGADDFVFKEMEIVEGNIDLEKLKSGKYIIYGLERKPTAEEYIGKISDEWKYFHVGDKITLCGSGKTQEYEILCVCVVNHSYAEQNNYAYPGHELTFYLPTNEYLIYGNDYAMRYLFNVTDVEAMEKEMGALRYESCNMWRERYEEDANKIKMVAQYFGIACVGIGIFVYCNTILVSLMSRKNEFIILSEIGISKKQILRMLLAEGGLYAVIVSIVSIGCTILMAYMCKFLLISETWSYQFTLEPAMYILMIIISLSLLIPIVTYRMVIESK